jgi:transcription elongation factor GreA
MERVPMTVYGLQKLQDELDHLQKVDRPQISEEIGIAREHGDLSENAEYHAAKEKQSFIEGRIAELTDKVGRAQAVDPLKMSGEKAMLSATVDVINVDTDEEHIYVLVGPDEADLDKGLISITSPLGHSLLGKEEGDEATFRAPGGEHIYEIVSVAFKEIDM